MGGRYILYVIYGFRVQVTTGKGNRIALFTCERENEEFQSHLERVILEVLKAIQYWDSYAVLQAIFIYVLCIFFHFSSRVRPAGYITCCIGLKVKIVKSASHVSMKDAPRKCR